MMKRRGFALLVAAMFVPVLVGADSCDLSGYGYGTVDLSTKKGQQALGTVAIATFIMAAWYS